MNKILAPFVCMFVAVAALAFFASAGSPPVSYAMLFGQNVPGQPGWTNTFQVNALPVGYGCTSVTVSIDQFEWQRAFAVTNRSPDTDGIVTFNSTDANGKPSWQGGELRGPDGRVYAFVRDIVPPFTVSLPPSSKKPFGVPYDQVTTPILPAFTFTVPVPPGSFESATAPMPQQVWTMTFPSEYFTTYTSGNVSTQDRKTVWAHVVLTFNH